MVRIIKTLLSLAVAVMLVLGVVGCGAEAELPEDYDNSRFERTPYRVPSYGGYMLLLPQANPLGAPIFNVYNESTWEFSLLIAREEYGIFLYGGKDVGMTLYHNGQITYFTDWRWWQPRTIPPQLLYHDFDGDGEKELAVILPAGSGTGVSLSDLHMVRDGGNDIVSLLARDVREWMTYPIEEDVTFGDIVRFSFFNNNISVTVAIGRTYDNHPVPQFFGEIWADVIFDGEKFTLDNYGFSEYKIF